MDNKILYPKLAFPWKPYVICEIDIRVYSIDIMKAYNKRAFIYSLIEDSSESTYTLQDT